MPARLPLVLDPERADLHRQIQQLKLVVTQLEERLSRAQGKRTAAFFFKAHVVKGEKFLTCFLPVLRGNDSIDCNQQ